MPTNAQTLPHTIIVEDEIKLRENLIIGLSHLGLYVRGVADGIQLDAELAREPADVIVLDLGLPGEDGIEIARRIRACSEVGIIIVSARGMTEERIEGFQSGADVYFVKPVNIMELAAAIKSLGRRTAPREVHTGWQLHAEAASLTTPDNIKVRLNAQESDIVKLLLEKIGQDVSRSELLAAIDLPNDSSHYPRLDVMICRLRTKVLKSAPAFPLPIQTRYSRGYMFLKEPLT